MFADVILSVKNTPDSENRCRVADPASLKKLLACLSGAQNWESLYWWIWAPPMLRPVLLTHGDFWATRSFQDTIRYPYKCTPLPEPCIISHKMKYTIKRPVGATLECKFSLKSNNQLEWCEHKTSILSVVVVTQAINHLSYVIMGFVSACFERVKFSWEF